jgi:hypothetical protein
MEHPRHLFILTAQGVLPGTVDEVMRTLPVVALDETLFAMLGHTLEWIPTFGLAGTRLPYSLGHNLYQQMTAQSAAALRAVLGGWHTILSAHGATLRIPAGWVVIAGRVATRWWCELERDATLEALDTLLAWTTLLERGTHTIHYFDYSEDYRGADITTPYNLDDDLVHIGGGSSPSGYNQLISCAASDDPDVASSRAIEAVHALRGQHIHSFSRDLHTPPGLLMHEKLAWALYPLLWSQLDVRGRDGATRRRGIDIPYRNILDAQSAPAARRLFSGLRMVCAAAPALLTWPANDYSLVDDAHCWPNLTTDRDAFLLMLDGVLAAMDALECGDILLVWNA